MPKLSFNAVIFDLDGVITQTASLHRKAWKQMFDEYLTIREKRKGEGFEEFTLNDYLNYVDGRPRYEGVKNFLVSRGIHLPYGNPTNSPNEETICGLGNRKNQLFNTLINQGKVEIFATTIDFIKELKQNNIKIGVASSSKNCKAILITTGVQYLFDTRIDGVISSELGLKGKPEPDIFITACDNLGVHYDKAVVVEDAVSGVKAGENGHFGLVVGVARENNERELKSNGADIVVKDLGEITIDDIENWFTEGLEEEKWTLNYFDFNKNEEKKREALLTIGNGYFGTRGAMEEFDANDVNYPGTYIAGVYNQLESHIAGKTVINEDFVNCPNWLPITFKIDKDDWFNLETFNIINISRNLEFKGGKLHKRMLVKDNRGRETLIESIRIASMENPHIACLRYKINPLNYSSIITIRSSIDGAIINAGVDRYKQLSSKHLETIKQDGEDNISYLLVQTSQSEIQIVEASKLFIFENEKRITPKISVTSEVEGRIDSYFEWKTKPGKTICIDKIVAIYSSIDSDLDETTIPLQMALKTMQSDLNFDELVQKSINQWKNIWSKIDIKLEGDRFVQKILRLHMFHLMVTASPHNENIDAGIPARGLHGEAYRGHIFWDTLFILPFYSLHFPQITKSALLYRYKRLDSAREYAKENGYEGAMFPWQSGSSGKEETPTFHLNPRSGEWGPDYSSLQRHVSLAVAYNIWYYFWFTNDFEFIENYGAEIFLEICRFWISKVELNDQGFYEIWKIMGPDEFHEMLPNSKEEGLKDNSYTNIMVVWTLHRAFDILENLDVKRKEKVCKKINLTNLELEKWKDITKRMSIIMSDEGILAQFDGYFNLKELDWEDYRKKYGNIRRLDRILKAEGKTPDDYKVAKQADVLMTFYTLKPSEARDLIKGLGYIVQEDFLKINYDYYAKRTSHGSTLSKVVHSYLLNLLGRQEEGYEYYLDALKSDYIDIQGGTTGEGIHTGVMAGTVILTLNSIAGLDLRSNTVCLNPNLVKTWRKIEFNFDFKDATYSFNVTHKTVKFRVVSIKEKEVTINIRGTNISVRTQIPENLDEWTEYTITPSSN
ncbi:MAG: beta-phosphoglucomutase family hydrolase [Candidatus Hodarchaeota archaeon]